MKRPLVIARPEAVPDTVADRIRALAEEFPDGVCEFSGGLAGEITDNWQKSDFGAEPEVAKLSSRIGS